MSTVSDEGLPPLFSEQLVEEAQSFAAAVIGAFPELEGVAVTFSWRPPLDNLPVSVIKGRSGPLVGSGEVVRMTEQLIKSVNHMYARIERVLQDADSLMAEKARILRELEQQIEQRAAELVRGESDTTEPTR